MPDKSTRAKVSLAQQRLRALQEEAAALPHPERFAAQLEEVRAELAELEVAYEELEQQNDEILLTREAVEHQRHRYLQLFDEAPFGYLVTDAQGIIEEANQAAAGLLGVSQMNLPGKPLFIYLLEETPLRELLPRVCAGELVGELEAAIKPRRGREPFAAVLTVVRDQADRNRTARLRWAVRDVSRTKEAEEALRASEEQLRHSQRMEAIGRLAGGIAHSFNNLLAAIAFQCELLCDRLEKGDERRVNVQRIQDAEERAASLARQLLAFGRKQVLQPRVLHLNGVIQEMETMLGRLIGEHIRLEMELDPAGGVVNMDFGQLEQVILNLVVNARDAMPSGGVLALATANVEIAETVEGELPSGSYLELLVTDDGEGMSPEVMERLFEPFFTTKERGQGTGLGLATVHGIVHQSGGSIRVESEPRRGTRFTVLLPRATEDLHPEALPVRSGRRSRRGSEVVLLVEDEVNIREPAVEILEGKGYRVLAAEDAGRALVLAEEHAGIIHILVTDVVMPGMSGSELARLLSPRRPEMRVLYISGYPEDAISHHGVIDPEQNFLQKPFPPGRFLEKVREVLDAQAIRVA